MKRGNWKTAKAKKQDIARCGNGAPPHGSPAQPIKVDRLADVLAIINAQLPFRTRSK